MTMVQIQWTEEQDASLAKHWMAGLSCAQIARALADEGYPLRSRNAVIGRRSRLGLPGRDKYACHRQPGPRMARPKRARSAQPMLGPPKPLTTNAQPDAPLHVPLEELTWGICRAVSLTNEWGRPRYCGQPTGLQDEAFCPSCASRFYQRVETPYARKLRQSDNRMSAAMRALKPEYRTR